LQRGDKLSKFDKIFLGIIFGFIPPIILLLLGWWIGISLVIENKIILFVVSSFILGIFVDMILLRKWINIGYKLNNYILTGIYIFYSICIFGFFMGVPVFNIFMGVIAGIYIARRIINRNLEKREIKNKVMVTSMFSSIIILFISILSAYFALKDPYTAANLEGMFNLSFSLSLEMIIGLIIAGGLLLVLFQYLVTKKTSMFILRKGKYLT
jgi:uncharacterized protein YneF (UPF0154 family)